MRIKSKEEMKRKQKEMKNSSKGITLLSLVVTIIVLLILAGVSINLTLSEEGIITKAQEVGKYNQKATIIEEIKLKILDQQTQGITISKSNLVSMLSMYGTVIEENGQITSVKLEDGIEIGIDQIYTTSIIEDNSTYIYTKEQLESFRDLVNNGKTYENETVMLMNDIDLQGNENEPLTWWTPIGLKDVVAFKGTFDGNHHRISNLYIGKESDSKEEVAFFSNVNDATIKNITIIGNIEIKGENVAAGGIVERASGKVTIENCVSEVDIISTCTTRAIGGIVTQLSDNDNSILVIKNCTNLGNISAQNNVGGIFGYASGTKNITIQNCNNKGKLTTGGGRAGGCIGRIVRMQESNIIIEKFSNEGDIISETYEAGGVIGQCDGTLTTLEISHSNNNNSIQGRMTSGGFIGYSGKGIKVIIKNSYNIGNISSNYREAGGIIGDTDGINYLVNVYNVGKCISKDFGSGLINGSSGGMIGSSYYNDCQITIINGYNIGDMEAAKNASGILGATKIFSRIENVYNAGKLIGNATYGITSLPLATEKPENTQMKNAYFIDNVETGTNLENDNTIKITEQYINTQEFVKQLNQYVENNPTYEIDETMKVALLRWKLGDNGYPIFE